MYSFAFWQHSLRMAMVVSESFCLSAISLFNMWPRAFAKKNIYFHHVSYSVEHGESGTLQCYGYSCSSEDEPKWLVQLGCVSIIPYQGRFLICLFFPKQAWPLHAAIGMLCSSVKLGVYCIELSSCYISLNFWYELYKCFCYDGLTGNTTIWCGGTTPPIVWLQLPHATFQSGFILSLIYSVNCSNNIFNLYSLCHALDYSLQITYH